MSRAPRLERLSIGERIAWARDKYKLSQAQLGANLGVTRAAISQYEQDKIRPRPKVIDRLAELFNSEPEWFERGRGKAPDPLDAPVTIPEVNVAGLTAKVTDPRDLSIGREWKLPTAVFAGLIAPPDHIIAMQAPNAIQPIRVGDMLLIDTHHLAGEGVFLIIDPASGPRLHRYRAGIRDDARVIGLVIAYLRTL